MVTSSQDFKEIFQLVEKNSYSGCIFPFCQSGNSKLEQVDLVSNGEIRSWSLCAILPAPSPLTVVLFKTKKKKKPGRI